MIIKIADFSRECNMKSGLLLDEKANEYLSFLLRKSRYIDIVPIYSNEVDKSEINIFLHNVSVHKSFTILTGIL
jgi:hypothetical protein